VQPPDDETQRYAPLFEALAGAMGDLDLAFDGAEVIAHRRVDHALDEALRRCGVQSPAALGVLFRTLRGRTYAGCRLVRDGRGWRLDRT
jgi:hypothetical protein